MAKALSTTRRRQTAKNVTEWQKQVRPSHPLRPLKTYPNQVFSAIDDRDQLGGFDPLRRGGIYEARERVRCRRIIQATLRLTAADDMHPPKYAWHDKVRRIVAAHKLPPYRLARLVALAHNIADTSEWSMMEHGPSDFTWAPDAMSKEYGVTFARARTRATMVYAAALSLLIEVPLRSYFDVSTLFGYVMASQGVLPESSRAAASDVILRGLNGAMKREPFSPHAVEGAA